MSKNFVLRTRIKSNAKGTVFFRWLGKHGKALNPGQEVEVDGAYPSEVSHKRYKPCCVNDISRGIVDVTIITDLPVSSPADVAPIVDSSATSVEVSTGTADTDTRFGTGTVEDYLPKKVSLPGHDIDFPAGPENTKKMFETDTTLTHGEAAPISKEAQKESTASPTPNPAGEATKAPAKRRPGRRPAKQSTSDAPKKAAPKKTATKGA
jgi:hypothetical protein